MSYRSIGVTCRFAVALTLSVTMLTACGSLGHRAQNGAPTAVQKPYNPPDAYTAQLYHVLLGEVAGQRGQMEASAETYLDAAKISDDPRVAQRAMQVALFAHDETRAQQAAQRWLTLQPDSLEPRQALSLLYLRAGRVDDSVAEFDQLIGSAAKGSAGPLFIQIAVLLSREPNKATALQVMQGLTAKHETDPYAQLSLSQLAAMAQNLDLADRAVARALQLKPGWSDALIMRAQIQSARGNIDAALSGLRKASDAQPKNTDLRLNYARLLVQAKRANEARTQFERLAREAPKDADVQYALALLALDANQPKDAATYFKRLLTMGKHVDEARYYLGRIAEDERLYTEALNWYSQIEQGDHQPDAELRIAALLAKRGDLDAARARLQALQEQNPALATRAILVEGELLVRAQRQTEAMALYDQALQREPENNELLYARALLAENLNHLDILERDLRSILKRDPDNALALNALGYTLADRTTRFAEAQELIQRALRQLPNDAAVLDSMGWVEFRLGHYADAVKYLRKAYAVNEDAEVAAHLVEVLWASGDHAGAVKLGKKALKADPDTKALKNVMQRIAP